MTGTGEKASEDDDIPCEVCVTCEVCPIDIVDEELW
jgi:hypothetical protein